MAQTKRTPKHLRELIQRHDEFINYCEERIAAKTTVPVENQAAHIRQTTVECIVGQAEGAWVMLEAALMAYGCYAGYSNFGLKQTNADGAAHRSSVTPGHPEYRDWFRIYYTR